MERCRTTLKPAGVSVQSDGKVLQPLGELDNFDKRLDMANQNPLESSLD